MLDIVELEDIRDGNKRLESESFQDRRFWTTGNEELDLRDFVNVAREHGRECRCRLLVLALVEGVNYDEGGDLCFFERVNDNLFELKTKRFSFDIMVELQDLEQLFSELGVSVGNLEGKGREDCSKVAPVFVVS